jgi:NAD-dependent deacetylase
VQAIQHVEATTLIVIVGTSFKVYPFAGLLDYAQEMQKYWSLMRKRSLLRDQAAPILGMQKKFFRRLPPSYDIIANRMTEK